MDIHHSSDIVGTQYESVAVPSHSHSDTGIKKEKVLEESKADVRIPEGHTLPFLLAQNIPADIQKQRQGRSA